MYDDDFIGYFLSFNLGVMMFSVKNTVTAICLFCSLYANKVDVNSCSDCHWSEVLDYPIVINLKRCAKRFRKTCSFMNEAGFSHILRFEAVDGGLCNNFFFENLGIFLGTPAEKGCAASHLLLWKNIVDDPTDRLYFFICEDDMIPHTQFAKLFPLYWEATPKDFDLVMVGNFLPRDLQTNEMIVSIPTYLAHAYIISRTGAQKLLDFYKREGTGKIQLYMKEIDCFLRELMVRNDIIYYCYNGKKYPDRKKGKDYYKFGTGLCFQNRAIPSTIRDF